MAAARRYDRSPMPSKPLTARNSDKYKLYQEAVQNVEFEVGMVERFYKQIRKKNPKLLKEDFCGSFALCCEWVKRNKEYEAIGVDLDAEVLEWGRNNNLSELKPAQQERIRLIKADVNNISSPKVDIVCAFNFSYWIFQTRDLLRKYFKNCHKSLKSDGILVLDAFGGSRAHTEQEEPRRCTGFTYIWEHASFSPITHEMTCKIHFKFKDGSMMRNAFRYTWRLWSPAETTELLKEAGFRDVQFFFEGTDQKTGDGNGVFRRTVRGEAAECWIAYIVATK